MTTARHPWEDHYPQGLDWALEVPDAILPDLLRDTAAAHPERPAIWHRGARLTWAQLAEQAGLFAAALARAGIGPGDTVALFLPNTAFHPIAFFGALQAGARLVMLSPLDPIRVLAHKLRDSDARLLVGVDLASLLPTVTRLLDEGACPRAVIGDESRWGEMDEATAPLPSRPDLTAWEAFTAECSPMNTVNGISPSDCALLQYTGGTTGLPKGAMLSHRNLLAATLSVHRWADACYGAPARQVTLCLLPLFHIYALVVILLDSALRGGEIVLTPRFDPARALADIARHRVTYIPGVPTMWIAMAGRPEIEGADLSSLNQCGSGGAPLPVEVYNRVKQLTGLKLRGGWGMTEIAAAGTSIAPGRQHQKPGTIGTPLPGVELKIVDPADPARQLPEGEVGELAVRGPNICEGYWNQPEATAESHLAEGWMLTGDLCRMDGDGFFWLVDRKKDLILSGGFNVYPQMIEDAVYQHPAVAECLAIGLPDPYRGESAWIYVTLKPGAEPFDLPELQAFLADKLGRHEIPRGLEFRDLLPRTTVGKLSRKALRDEVLADAAQAAPDAGAQPAS